VTSHFGLEDEAKTTISLDLKASKSEEQKERAKILTASRVCDSEMACGLKATRDCEEARDAAASIDQLHGVLEVPKEISNSPYTAILSRLAKLYLLPYLSFEPSGMSGESRSQDNYKVMARLSPGGKSSSMSVTHGDRKTLLQGLRLGPSLKGLVPYATRQSLPLHLIQKVTDYGAPSTCSLEASTVSTFDGVFYNYTLNDCEHVVFKDCSESPKLLVSIRKSSSQIFVRVIIEGTEYELEQTKPSRSLRTASSKLKVNGNVQEGNRRGQSNTINYDDKANSITQYEDGVFEIASLKYGLVVRADGETLEVSMFQHYLRNLACGLCGDLNNEKTGDTLSAQQCVMSSPKLAAYSYMVRDKTCAGIPPEDKDAYTRQTQSCHTKTTVPTRVQDVFHATYAALKTQEASHRHLIQKKGQMICISMLPVPVCSRRGHLAEVIPTPIPFFCMAEDQEGATLLRMVERGERINSQGYVTTYVDTVYLGKC